VKNGQQHKDGEVDMPLRAHHKDVNFSNARLIMIARENATGTRRLWFRSPNICRAVSIDRFDATKPTRTLCTK
jgi:hypothetical protein